MAARRAAVGRRAGVFLVFLLAIYWAANMGHLVQISGHRKKRKKLAKQCELC
jgi:hypothetical protein